MKSSLEIIILGLSITSSWGNGHATTYRGLIRELAARGHRVLFLERDVPWYSENRDMARPPFCETRLYSSFRELKSQYARDIRAADLVIVGSYVPEGIEIGEWVTRAAGGVAAFYDIDTPVTLARIRANDCDYLSRKLVSSYDLYLSFSGGRAVEILENQLRSPLARPLYCSVDPTLYYPEPRNIRYDLAYMGTYSADRQPPLDRLLVEPARRWKEGRFLIAGPQYPDSLLWPDNVRRVEHLPPSAHRDFYNEQRFTLNVTRADMIEMGYSPSVRLFEAAACGTPIISDDWEGLSDFLKPDEEILIAHSSEEALRYLREVDDKAAEAIGERAREKILRHHTAAHRAVELESYYSEACAGQMENAAEALETRLATE